MELVEATESHIPAIAVFFREAWKMTGPHAPGWAGADQQVIEHLARPETLGERIGGPERQMLLAFEDERVVAFAATRWNGEGPAELAGIVVLQEMVGQGVGTSLLQVALERLRADGATSVFVRTEVDNERALGFHRAHGFRDRGSFTEDVEGTKVAVTELSRPIAPT